MPLVRFEVRNEYGLGDPELHRRAAGREDSKALLDGVAVAGLVGILRQLGDLAEFAADVFRDLHEQVSATSGRGRKMMTRIKNIEAMLPSIEKAVQGQSSHIHFAYVAGCDWHANVQMEESHLLSSDLPQFIMDSYEECRDPPSFYLLDKFDSSGAGACLKRYSDPSYFKRAWAASELARAEKFPREKKPQKYKRKGSRLRSREFQHSISITQRSSSSTQLASPSNDGRSVSSDHTSISDMRLKPEVTSASTTFDSKTTLNHVNHVFNVKPSVMPDEQELENPSGVNLEIKDEDNRVACTRDEPVGRSADNYSQHNLVEEPSVHRSPPVTWDEKIEIVMPSNVKSSDDIIVDKVQDSELLEVRCDLLHVDHEIVNLGTEQEDILVDFENLRVPASGGNHFDEGASETDNYMDALNTMGSETETDSECQTKQEVRSLWKCTCQGLESGRGKVEELAASNLDSSGVEAPTASDVSLNKDGCTQFSHLDNSESLSCVHTTHRNGFAPIPDFYLGTVHSESDIHHMPRVRAIKDLSMVPELSTLNDNTPAHTSKLQDLPVEVSSFPPPTFWTNGELFGVEPSKPPVFGNQDTVFETILSSRPSGASNTVSTTNKSVSDNSFLVERMCASPNISKATDQRTLGSDQLTGKAYDVLEPVDTLKCAFIHRDDHHESISIEHNFEKPVQTLQLTEAENPGSSTSNGVYPSAAELPDIYNIKSLCNQPGQHSLRISSSSSGLAQRFVSDSLQRKPLLTIADNSMASKRVNIGSKNSEETSVPSECQEMPNGGVSSRVSNEPMMREKYEMRTLRRSISSSSHYSEQSSPPLEHMKLSFHPMNSSETSKLKLDYSNGNTHESNEDLMFPIFQLLPGPTVPLHDGACESDDDTFCQSCPYSSEGSLSPRSYSNSELWEQDEKSTNKNHGVYGDSRRISSSSASVSSFVGFDEMNDCRIDPGATGNLGIINGSTGGPTAVLPGLDPVNYLKNRQEREHKSTPISPMNSTVWSPNDLPPPPPLPPVQWRMMKSIFTSGEEKVSVPTENDDHFVVSHDHSFGARQEQGPNVHKPAPTTEAIELSNITPGKQTLNGHTQRNQGISNKVPDVREELLQQIRNKAFNLRRTAIVKPNSVPQPTTNVNVTAILEKADAIRQAFVGGDEGCGNDSWSDC